MRSDLVCVYDAPQDGQSYVRGKLYEYLASLHPILAIIPEGAMHDLLSDWDCAYIAHPDDTTAIKSQLEHIIQNQNCDPSSSASRLVQYEYEDLARQCARVLDVHSGNMSITSDSE